MPYTTPRTRTSGWSRFVFALLRCVRFSVGISPGCRRLRRPQPPHDPQWTSYTTCTRFAKDVVCWVPTDIHFACGSTCFQMTPSASWGGNGLLGLSIRFCMPTKPCLGSLVQQPSVEATSQSVAQSAVWMAGPLQTDTQKIPYCTVQARLMARARTCGISWMWRRIRQPHRSASFYSLP